MMKNTLLFRKSNALLFWSLALLLLLNTQFSWGQTSVTTQSTAGNGTIVVPSGVSTLTVECTGAGGGGGGTLSNIWARGGGGAGGAYVKNISSVTAGTYNFTAGGGGISGVAGGNSYFGNTSAGNSTGATVLAPGGANGSNATSAGTGNTAWSSSAAGTASTASALPASGYTNLFAGTSGTVGSGTGNTSSSFSGTGGAGAASGGSASGGAGGGAVSYSTAGTSGTAPGGGGGGGIQGSGSTTPRVGGTGGAGRVVVTYYSVPTILGISPTNANAGSSGFTITVVGTNFFNGVSVVTWGGNQLTTTYVSSTSITATVPSGNIVSGGTSAVGVTNTGSFGTSNSTSTQTFTINAIVPTITTDATPTVIATNNATFGGNVTATGGANISGNGVVYAVTATNATPAISGTGVTQVANGSPGTGTGSFTVGTGNVLSPNVQYSYRAYATNSAGTSYGGGSGTTFYTLANTPSVPTVSNNGTSTTLEVSVNANSNPSTTEFAIQETGTSNYVQADGSINTTQVWQTASTWGTKTVTGLSASTSYTFKVKARNGANTETAFGSTANATTSAGSSPVASITGPIAEESLGGYALGLTLTNETFSSTSPATTDFTLNNAPSGLSISSVTYNSTTSVTLNLAFTGDIDANVTNLNITVSGSIVTSSASVTSNSITLTALVESISVGTVTAFGNQTVNTTSSEKTFNITATARATVSITPPSGYEISTGTGGSFVATNPINLSPTGTSLASTPIYIRFKPTTVTSYSGNISSSSTGATSASVAISGTGTSPSNPSGFTATAVSATQINLSVGGSANVVIVYNGTGTFSTPTDGVAAGSQGVSFAGGTIWYNGAAGSATNHTSLTANTLYYYKVFVYDGLNFYSAGLTANASTSKVEPTSQATNLAFSSQTTSSFNTAFTVATGTPDGYIVIRSTSSSLSADPADASTYTVGNSIGGGTVVSLGATVSGITNTSLSAGTTYYTFVYSYNNSGSLIDYLTTSALTGSTTTLSVAPSPSTSNVAFSSFDISWISVTGATSYQLDVTTDAGFTTPVSGYNGITATSPTSVTGLDANTTYYYRVRAVNAGGNGAYGTGSQLTAGLSAPTATSATSITSTSFTANWGAVTGASSYKLDVATSTLFGGTSTVSSDDFEGTLGNWSNTSNWVASSSTPITGSNSLKHNLSNTAGESYIYNQPTTYNLSNGTTTWQFNLKNGNFATSSNNKFTVFLASDITNISSSGSQNGYAVGINMGSVTDNVISLYRIDNGTATRIITTGASAWAASTTYGIRVTRTVAGSWTVEYKSGGGFTSMTASSSASDANYTTATYCGLDFTYTSTRAGLLFFDDLSIKQVVNTYVSGYQDLSVSGTSQSVTGLTQATPYYYRVRAISTNSTSANSNTITVTTKKTPTVTPTIGSYTYNGSAQGPNSITAITPAPTSVTYSYEGVSPTVYAASSTRPTNAGSYIVTATVEADSNYVSASSSATAFSIGKATLTITARSQSVCFGTAVETVTGAGTYDVTGYVNSETSSVISGSATYTTTYTATAPAATGGITITPVVTGLSASNYQFSAATGTITVNPTLTASVAITATPSGAICAGTSVAFTATPTNGGSSPAYQWKVNGSNVGTNSATYTTTGLANNDVVTVVMTSNATPCLAGSPATSNSITTVIQSKWLGTASSSWSNPGNWTCGVPSSTDNIVIDSGSPVLDTDFTVGSLGTLTISNTGTLTINSTKTLTIAGAANFGGQSVTIKSDATGTGAIGQITGTLTGATNVTVERYIPNKRAWRALTAPLKANVSDKSVFSQWQNNGDRTNTAIGIELWGPAGTGSAGNGLEVGPSNSILQYNNSSTGAWATVTDTKTTNLFTTNRNNAFMVFPTGGYGSGYISSSVPATETTLKATGQLITGDVPYSSLPNTSHTLIGNPYASPIDLNSILDANTTLEKFFWVWDPKGANQGTYNTFDAAANTYTFTNVSYSNSTVIQSGQAFFVKALTGQTGSFTISESNKSTGSSNAVFRTAAPELLRVGLYKQVNNEWSGRDGAMTVILNDADANQTANKMANGTENVAFTKNGLLFASEHHLPLVASDVLNVKVWNTTAGTNYKLKINTEQFNTTNLNATLEDLFTNSRTSIALDGTAVEYPFAVTTEAASTGNRFRIVFENSALGINNPKASGISILPNPITGDTFQVNLGTLSTGTYSYSISNALGQEVENGSINNVTQNTSYTVKFKNNTAAGMYIMKVTGTDNSVFTAKLIKK